MLTFKALSKIVTDDTLMFLLSFRENKRFSAKQMIHMKFSALSSLKNNHKKYVICCSCD